VSSGILENASMIRTANPYGNLLLPTRRLRFHARAKRGLRTASAWHGVDSARQSALGLLPRLWLRPRPAGANAFLLTHRRRAAGFFAGIGVQ
jgi:hypothetical protein